MKETVIYGRIVTPFQIIKDGVLIVRDGKITYVGYKEEREVAVDCQILRFNGQDEYIIPGFVDNHCHGGGGYFSYEHPVEYADFHLQHGTTSILPTFVYNQTHREIITGLKKVLSAMESSNTSILGIHMEGPYINPKYGAITSPIRPVDPQEYREILKLAGNQILLWTLAPELDGQQQFMEEASAYGITFSVGHSEASPEDIFDSVQYGLRVGCHLTDASGVTPNKTRYSGTREVGVHEAVMIHDQMYAEVIPDRVGIHVRPLMLRLIVKAKGVNKVIIITDGVKDAGLIAPNELDVNLKPSTKHSPGGEGRMMLSGSLLTMDRAVRNMRMHTGVSMVDVCKMASLNPALALGMAGEIGSLERGKRANLLVVSEDIDIKMVMLSGKIVSE